MQIQAYMIALVQNIKQMMGNGPVVEVDLHQVAQGVQVTMGSRFLAKLEIFFEFLRAPVFVWGFFNTPKCFWHAITEIRQFLIYR